MNNEDRKRTDYLFKGTNSNLKVTDPDWVDITVNFSQNETINASKLTEKEQMLCILSVLLGCQGMGEFHNMLHAALNMGIDPIAIKEVIYQATAYLGIGRVYDFLQRQIKLWNSMESDCHFCHRRQQVKRQDLKMD